TPAMLRTRHRIWRRVYWPHRSGGTSPRRASHTRCRTLRPLDCPPRTSCNALRQPSCRQMVEYRDWAGEFIDAELDGGATASKRIVKKDGTMLEPDFDTV